MTNDSETLLRLNRDYIHSVQHSDVARFEQILAEDFICITAEGQRLDRAEFLIRTAAPVTIRNLEATEVEVRILGDFALIHARSVYTTADGKSGSRRYTDGWARRNGQWLAVSAQLTLVPAATI